MTNSLGLPFDGAVIGDFRKPQMRDATQRRVGIDLTITYQGRRYPVSFAPGDVVWVEPLPEQDAVRILGLYEQQPDISASDDLPHNHDHIDHAANTERRSDSSTTTCTKPSHLACPFYRETAPANPQARRYCDRTGSGHGEAGAFSADQGEIVLPLSDYDTLCSDT